MVDTLLCNLSQTIRTIHNKWLQQLGNQGKDLFANTCHNNIQANTNDNLFANTCHNNIQTNANDKLLSILEQLRIMVGAIQARL